MAVKENIWNFEVQGVPYRVELKKNAISVNGAEPVKLNKLARKSSLTETHYSIMIEGKEAVLHIRQFGAAVLSYDGRDMGLYCPACGRFLLPDRRGNRRHLTGIHHHCHSGGSLQPEEVNGRACTGLYRNLAVINHCTVYSGSRHRFAHVLIRQKWRKL